MRRSPVVSTDPVVARVVRRVVDEVQPLRVILFGSRATGGARTDSDVDLLVVVPEGTDRRAVIDRLHGARLDATVGVDVLAVTPDVLDRERGNPGLLYGEILDTGREVYAAP